MRQLLFTLLLFSVVQCDAQVLTRAQMRTALLGAFDRKSALDSLLSSLQQNSYLTPVEQSYLGTCTGLCCMHVDGNWKKLKLVLKAKDFLDEAAKRDSKDPEIRLMRFLIEHNLPSFLGMNKHIPGDLEVIFANQKFIDESPRLKLVVLEFLQNSGRCSDAQKQILATELAAVKKQLATNQ